MAGRPSLVAGILISTLGRSTAAHSAWAEAMVPSVSLARSGSTSIETRPSTRVRVGDRGEDVAGVADVLGGELEDDPVDGCAVGDELADLLVVALAVGDGAGEDRRVGGHARRPTCP